MSYEFCKKTLSLRIVIGYELMSVKLKPSPAMAQYFHECRMNLIRQTKRLHPPELSDHTLNRLYWHHNQRVMKPSKWLTACQRDLPSPGDIQLKAFLAPNSKQLMTFVQRFAPKKLINCGENQLESCEAETSRNYSVDRPVKIPDQSVITCVQITVGECLSAEQLRTECCQFFLRIFSLNWSADMQNSGWRPLTANKIPTRSRVTWCRWDGNQSIALEQLYIFVIRSVNVSSSVRLQIHENCGSWRHLSLKIADFGAFCTWTVPRIALDSKDLR